VNTKIKTWSLLASGLTTLENKSLGWFSLACVEIQKHPTELNRLGVSVFLQAVDTGCQDVKQGNQIKIVRNVRTAVEFSCDTYETFVN